MLKASSAIKILLGLFMILSLRHQPVAQVQDSVFISPPQPVEAPLKNEPELAENLKDEEPKEEKANPKLIAAVCLFIITTTLLLYHVRSK